MGKLEQLDEPSMEEILASIRRAIDEDSRFTIDHPTASRGAGRPAVTEAAASDHVIKLADDVLELTRTSRSHDRRAGSRRQPAPAADEPSILRPAFGHRTELLNDGAESDESADKAATAVTVPETVSGVAGMRRDRDADGPIASGEAVDPIDSVRMATGEPTAMPVSQAPMIAADIDKMVAAAFEKLAGQVAEARSRPSPTLEDMAKDLMRPVITDWLAANLSDIVAKMVQSEIERVTRRYGA